MEEEQGEVEDAAGHRPPVHQHMLLPQVPPPRPHLQNVLAGRQSGAEADPVFDLLQDQGCWS